MTPRVTALCRFLLPILLVVILLVTARSTPLAQAGAQPAAAAPAATACPGQPMAVQATGVYTPVTIPEIVINKQPGPGAIWQPGMRSYWHCHGGGGQIMMVHQGVGRVQQRGERARTLHRGETEFADAGVEHWHGAAHDVSAIFFQTTIGTGQTLWMEEVSRDDYMGNDIGLTSRAEFLRTGVRQKTTATKP
jgi:hypothetical protein